MNRYKRSRKSPLPIVTVVYRTTYKENGQETTVDQTLGYYFTREAATADLIEMLNRKYEANIPAENPEALNEWISRFNKTGIKLYGLSCKWIITEALVSDKNSLNN